MYSNRTAAPLLLRSCPRCGTDNSGSRVLGYSWQQWHLRRCRACDFVYLENPPDYSGLSVDYAWETDDYAQRMSEEYPLTRSLSRGWRRVRRRLIPRPDKLARRVTAHVPPGRVIDVGCGSAGHLLALERHHEIVGIEISVALAGQAEARLASRSGTVVNMPAIEGLAAMAPASASGVLMRSFLEHEHRPAALLAEVARVLVAGGAVVVKVPNFGCLNRRLMGSRWCGFRFPGHVNYFTPASLREMVEGAGLTVTEFGLFDRFPFADNMWLVAHRT
ncbi:MAG: methyltransferase domain-containing protein [Chloroflexota bacterium]|nr:methyltransferase domain-containing protein [Chloroflexota bacterium]